MKRFLTLTAVFTLFCAVISAQSTAKTEDFVRVDCGGFVMGNEYEHETEHRAWVSEFFICKHEVTQEEYETLMGTNPSKFKGKNRPVDSVAWFDAIEYCNRRSIAEGYTPCYTEDNEMNLGADGYRLPTETEWEFASRGGSESMGFRYSGSDGFGSVAWCGDNTGDETHEVMTKAPNELGIYDMSGNVAEWCWDRYGDYPSEGEEMDPEGPEYGLKRILRGGSYLHTRDQCTSTFRNCDDPSNDCCNYGFRVVRSGTRG